MPRLVKRKVTEETFQHDDAEEELDGADLDGEAEGETDEAEPAKPKRRARR